MLKFRLLPITLVFCLAVPVYAQTIFKDDFDDPDVSKGNWEIASGVWELKDGMLYCQWTKIVDDWVAIYVSDSKWGMDAPGKFSEYTIEFNFMREEGVECCRPLFRVIGEPLPATKEERDKGLY
jgi:hypothetical protein